MPSSPVLPTHRIRRALALLLATLTFAVPAVFAQEDEEADRARDFLELQHTLSTNFVTPHTAWAKPYAGGRLRAVFFAAAGIVAVAAVFAVGFAGRGRSAAVD